MATTLDPRIGKLTNGMYYAFVNGYDRPETRGTLMEVEVALGIRKAPKASRPYVVTIIPECEVWSGAWHVSPERPILHEVDAHSHADAISKARKYVRDEVWLEVPCTYRARLA